MSQFYTSGSDLRTQLYENLDRRTIPGLTGLRAIAAFAVIIYHFCQVPGWHTVFAPGPYGVVCFFVLSGFLITWLLLKERDRTGTVDLKAFWLRRALRIFPAFYVYWLVQAALLGRVPADLWASAFYFYNYFQGFQHQWVMGVVAHTWTLAVEEQFYLLWPFVFVLIRNRMTLKRSLALAILAVQIARAIAWRWIPEAYIYEAFEFRCDALMLGCLLAIALRDRDPLPGWLLHPVMGIAAVCVFPLMMKGNSVTVFNAIGNTATAYASAILILQAIAYAPWFLENRLVTYLGTLSYAIYLYHGLFLDVVLHHRTWSTPLLFLMYTVGTVGAASASYYLVEKPFLRMKRRAVG